MRMKSLAPVTISTTAAAAVLGLVLAMLPVPILAFFITTTTTSSRTMTTTTIPFKHSLYSSPFSKKAEVQRQVQLQVASTPTTQQETTAAASNFGEGNGKIKQALKKMRGSSVSISYSNNADAVSSSSSSSSMDMEILSQELRKSAKVSSIFTNDLNAVKQFSEEQQLAAGNFPGPCPIIYNNPAAHFVLADDGIENDDVKTLSIQSVIDNGASGVVLDITSIKSLFHDNHNENEIDIDIICDVQSADDIKEALSIGYNYAFLIHAVTNSNQEEENDESDNSKIKEMLSVVPIDAVVICSLEAMQPNNCEITRGKDILSLSFSPPSTSTASSNSSTASSGSLGSGSGSVTSFSLSATSFSSSSSLPPPPPSPVVTSTKVHGLLIENACVGDDEDLKYTSFAVNSITKKSSSTFAMTGLTGSTNGHFGTMSDNASVENAKWKRVSN